MLDYVNDISSGLTFLEQNGIHFRDLKTTVMNDRGRLLSLTSASQMSSRESRSRRFNEQISRQLELISDESRIDETRAEKEELLPLLLNNSKNMWPKIYRS